MSLRFDLEVRDTVSLQLAARLTVVSLWTPFNVEGTSFHVTLLALTLDKLENLSGP